MPNPDNTYGNPFSYLTTSNPKRSSFRASERSETEDPPGQRQESKSPFSYLSPGNEPPARVSTGSAADEGKIEPTREMGDGQEPIDVFASNRNLAKRLDDPRGVFSSDRNLSRRPESPRDRILSNSKKEGAFDFESAYDPPPANHYASMQRLAQKQGSSYDPGYQGQQNLAYHPTEDYHEYVELPKENGKSFYHSGEHKPIDGGAADTNHGTDLKTPTTPRPQSRDSALGASYRSNSSRGSSGKGGLSCPCWAVGVLVIVTALVFIGVGFAVGWFVKTTTSTSAVVLVASTTADVQETSSTSTTKMESISASSNAPSPPSMASITASSTSPEPPSSTSQPTSAAAPENQDTTPDPV